MLIDHDPTWQPTWQSHYLPARDDVAAASGYDPLQRDMKRAKLAGRQYDGGRLRGDLARGRPHRVLQRAIRSNVNLRKR